MAKDSRLNTMSIDEIFRYKPIIEQMASTGYSEIELRPILEDYEKQRPRYLEIAQEYAQIIGSFQGVHSIRSRVKTVGSFCEKILRKNDARRPKVSITNYQVEIQDLIGIRALYVFPDEFAIVCDQIYKEFAPHFFGNPVVRYRKGDNLEIFKKYFSESHVIYPETDDDYRSIHYIFQHLEPSVRIELQIRTIFEEGWSEINHRTVYGMEDSPNATTLRVLSPILSRLVGTCNDVGSLIYSIAYADMNKDVNQIIEDSLQSSESSPPSLVDALKKYIQEL